MLRAQGPAAAYDALHMQFAAHTDAVLALRDELLAAVPHALAHASDDERAAARAFVDDPEGLFRFLRRSRLDAARARDAVLASLEWRRASAIEAAADGALLSPYMSGTHDHVPLFWLHSRFRDRLGRPCLYVALRHFERGADGALGDLRDAIVVCLEVARRYLARVNRRRRSAVPPVLQLTVALDMCGAGATNLELEMLPYVRELLRLHYPSLFGTVYIVHYGWLHGGMWRIARPLLPASLIARIRFADELELDEHFGPALVTHLGGTLDVPVLTDSSDVFQYLGRPHPRRTPSERTDFESIYDVVTRSGTPHRVLTPLHSAPGTPTLRPSSGICAGVAPTAVAASLRELAEADGGGQWRWWDWASWWGAVSGRRRRAARDDDVAPADLGPPAPPDARRAPPAPPPAPAPPAPRRGPAGLPTADSVSPYHPQNPFFGYPVTVEAARGRAHPGLRANRQKRHLLRTLLYLFMLRLLRVYRQVRHGVHTLALGAVHVLHARGRQLTLTYALTHSAATRVTLVLGLLMLAWPQQQAPLHLVLEANSG